MEIDINFSIEKIYLYLYTEATQTLKSFYKEGIPQSTAIDIKEVAKSLGINVIEKNMESANELFTNETMGYLDGFAYQGSDIKWSIYVNDALGDLAKRYVIAHELAHYLLKKNDRISFTKYCIGSMMPKHPEELLCDIEASFLLMPIESVFELMDDYIKEHKNTKVDSNKWLTFLGRSLGISDYYTLIFYQNIRYLAAFLYYGKSKGDLSEETYKIINKMDQYEYLFR